jgi:uncharacterized membrane protein (DUF106 family)
LHEKDFPDMQIAILDKVSFDKVSSKQLNEVEALKMLKNEEFHQIMLHIKKNKEGLRKGKAAIAIDDLDKGFVALYNVDPRFNNEAMSFADIANAMMSLSVENTLRHTALKNIKETVGDLKKDAQAIQADELKTKMIEKIEKLETQMRSSEDKTEEQINRIRQLIGTSEKYLEWRAFTADFEHIKTTHIAREVFDSKINELSTRIDSLSEIKKAYDTVLAQQNEFMKQQAEVMKQQSSFVTWIKYATVLVPIAVVLVPVIDLLLRHFLNIS